MLSQFNNYIFSILIVFTFTFTYVSTVTCDIYQRPCSSGSPFFNTWCCQNYQYCGDSFGCLTYTTTMSPPSDFTPGVTTAIIAITFFFCILCISCCIRSQRQQQLQQRRIHPARINTNGRVAPHLYQQQPARRPPPRVVHNRPVPNVTAAPSIHFMHEEPPPSYEVATGNLPPQYPSAPSELPPVTSTVNQAYLRV